MSEPKVERVSQRAVDHVNRLLDRPGIHRAVDLAERFGDAGTAERGRVPPSGPSTPHTRSPNTTARYGNLRAGAAHGRAPAPVCAGPPLRSPNRAAAAE